MTVGGVARRFEAGGFASTLVSNSSTSPASNSLCLARRSSGDLSGFETGELPLGAPCGAGRRGYPGEGEVRSDGEAEDGSVSLRGPFLTSTAPALTIIFFLANILLRHAVSTSDRSGWPYFRPEEKYLEFEFGQTNPTFCFRRASNDPQTFT